MTTLFDKQEQLKSRGILLSTLSHEQEVYVIVRHVSQSGMSRKLSFLAVIDGELRDITWHVSYVSGKNPQDYKGHYVMNVKGAGMDMAFASVYDLSHVLYGSGYLLKSRII